MSLGKSSLLFSFGTLLSRLLGLVREVILAAFFGASSLLDAFFVANRIPNMLRELAAEGALGSSFTKVFSDLKEKDEKEARKLISHLTVFLCLILFFLCLIGISFAPFLVKSLLLFDTGDGSSDFYSHTVGLTRILFPFIAFMSLASVFAGALHQKGRFFISSISPMALNLGYILGAVCFSFLLKEYGPLWIETSFAPRELVGLALGVLLGGFLQMMILFIGVKKSFFQGKVFFSEGFRFRFTEPLQKVFLLMWPMVVAASAGQFNVLINTNFATSLDDGSVSYLSFAFRLFQLPIGVFAVAIGTASLPLLAKNLLVDKSYDSFNKSFEKTIELTIWLLVPSMGFLLMNSDELVSVLFERGQFTKEAVYQTSDVLFSYSLGLLSYGFVKVLTSLFFALERIRFAMRVSLVSIVSNFCLNLYFVKHGVSGLALSTSLVMTLSAALLFWGAFRDEKIRVSKNKILRLLICVLFAFFLSLILQPFLANVITSSLGLSARTFYIKLFLLFLKGSVCVGLFALSFFFYRKK